jgi:Fic family protein
VSDRERHSEAAEASLITDEDQRARRESENAVAQFDMVLDLIEEVTRTEKPFKLRVSVILSLHRRALEGLSAYAGTTRPGDVSIGKSKHAPPQAHRVPELLEEMCDYVNEKWSEATPIHLCAYVMWRLNWIHPFVDGNGRTSRAISYYVLCAKLGYVLPGHQTVPEQIAADKEPYYVALEAADEEFEKAVVDVSRMEALLDDCIATQLLSAYRDASDPSAGGPKERKLH